MKNVYFDSIDTINKHLRGRDFSQLFVLTDTNTEKYCLPLLEKALVNTSINKICIDAGEINKNLKSCVSVWNALTELNADRNALLLNLGGGVVTDLGGFCASTYKRGIRFINLPTSLLAQVDASVGSKTGVDFEGYKNHIGLFSETEFVLIDNHFHKSLPQREVVSGYAEMLKHALIDSPSHWKNLLDCDLTEIPLRLIKESVAIKSRIVEMDPKESGLRKLLNLGHTLGHAVESYYLNTNDHLLHGEAIAIGMILENRISVKIGLLEEQISEEINAELEKICTLPHLSKKAIEEIIMLCQNDKKNKDSKILMSLLTKIGTAKYNVEVPNQVIKETLLEVSKAET